MPLNPKQKTGILSAVALAMQSAAQSRPDQWASLSHAHSIIAALPVKRLCVECLHHQSGRCLHWACRIPPDWIHHGCDEWDEEIPF